MLSLKQKVGLRAEKIARHYLEQQGLSLITQNFHYKNGEIDLIMSDKSTLVFIEVRYRHSINFIDPLSTISFTKQNHLIKTAVYYLKKHHIIDKIVCRFDVIGISKDDSINWIKNAIEVEY